MNKLQVDNGDSVHTNVRIARIQGSGGVLYEH